MNAMTQPQFNPNDFMEDAKGNLVPKSKIKDVELLRDDAVRDMFTKAKVVSEEMRAFKASIFDDIEQFCEYSASEYDTTWGGERGNIELTSFDGSLKVTKTVADIETVDERIRIAEKLIKECANEWSSGSDDKVKALVNLAFKVDKKGKLSTSRLRQLKQLNIKDEKWQRAMQAIDDSIKAVGTCEYVRFYKRDEHGKYQQMPMDMAKM